MPGVELERTNTALQPNEVTTINDSPTGTCETCITKWAAFVLYS